MRILRACFRSRRDFIRHYSLRHHGAVLCRTRTSLRTGEAVVLEITFPELGPPVLVRGVVGSHDDLEAGFWIHLPLEERATRNFVLARARGKGVALGRHHFRLPLALPVDWQADGAPAYFVSQTADLGPGGLFLRTMTPPAIGTEVTLRLAVPEVGEMLLWGKVSWSRDSDDPGMGVRFSNPSDRTVRRLRTALRHLTERGAIPAAA